MDAKRDLFLMNQIYGTLFSLTNKVQIKGDRHIKDLTSRQFMTMIAIVHLAENQTTINNVARKLGTTKQSVKQLISVIQKKGYILVVPSKADKRALNIRITGSGRQIMLKCSEKSIEFMLHLFQNFSTEEMEILWALLKKLYKFDGEEQDGFEKNVSFEISKEENESQNKVLNKFIKKRNGGNSI